VLIRPGSPRDVDAGSGLSRTEKQELSDGSVIATHVKQRAGVFRDLDPSPGYSDTALPGDHQGGLAQLVRRRIVMNPLQEQAGAVPNGQRAADNPLHTASDIGFWVDSRAYNIVECTHMIWLTAVIDMLVGVAEYKVT